MLVFQDVWCAEERLFQAYVQRTPSFVKAVDLLTAKGGEIHNAAGTFIKLQLFVTKKEDRLFGSFDSQIFWTFKRFKRHLFGWTIQLWKWSCGWISGSSRIRMGFPFVCPKDHMALRSFVDSQGGVAGVWSWLCMCVYCICICVQYLNHLYTCAKFWCQAAKKHFTVRKVDMLWCLNFTG